MHTTAGAESTPSSVSGHLNTFRSAGGVRPRSKAIHPGPQTGECAGSTDGRTPTLTATLETRPYRPLPTGTNQNATPTPLLMTHLTSAGGKHNWRTGGKTLRIITVFHFYTPTLALKKHNERSSGPWFDTLGPEVHDRGGRSTTDTDRSESGV